ncbi:MAG: tautomerase family protein [Oscillospiraceae bacterium]|nr:tautomerase family protein [Oscillospiraceae bacterium]
MPHIEIKCFPGRSEEQKKLLAQKVAQDTAEILNSKISSVSVVIKDVEEDNWKEEVWDKQILADKDFLYKKPGYEIK